MAPVVPSRVQAARHQPQALASLIWTVEPVSPSGAVRPLISRLELQVAPAVPLPRKQPQSPFSMLCWKFSGLPVVLAGGEPEADCTAA